jgi:hypothetical protein
MRRIILLVTIIPLLVGTTIFAQKNEAEGGDYYVTGSELDGREYIGGMEILENGDAYIVSYQLGTQLYGAGILLNDVFAVASGGAQCVVGAYERTDNGFAGQWTAIGTGTLQSEQAVVMSNQDNILDMALSGQNANGAPYEGSMTITTTSDQTIDVEQVYDNTTYSGTGIVVGDVFAVAFGDNACSVAAYAVQDDGSLVGSWTTVGETRIANESAVPVSIVGQHNVTGTNQDGSQYRGTLDVSADNQVHNFTWVVGGNTLEGVGVLRGNVVTAAFGNEQCAVMSYFVLQDGSLSGQWAFIGTDISGSEVATLSEGRSPAEDLSGAYSVTGINPDGTEYGGELDIVQNADGATLGLTWTFGSNPQVQGVGIRQGNMLLVGYGPEGCGMNVFNVTPDEMSGPFAQIGVSGTGTETAIR